VTYTRALHLAMPLGLVAIWAFILIDRVWLVAILVIPAALVPMMRVVEGVQAQLLLTPAERGRPDASISVGPSASWNDRLRMVLWLETRIALSVLLAAVGVPLVQLCIDLARGAAGGEPNRDALLRLTAQHWWYAPLIVIPIAILLLAIVGLGEVVTALARLLLGPSPVERMRLLEERTEQLLEHNRLARELHDSIGHALTLAVLQAGAARTAGDPAFTERALSAIEGTGRAALADLERVLLILREPTQQPGQRPTLNEARRLIDSTRMAGLDVDYTLSGSVDRVPGPVSRECYRILQEALTNVLRHGGDPSGPIKVTVTIDEMNLEVAVVNPVRGRSVPWTGSGLRGIRERAELLGGSVCIGPRDGSWIVHVRLPIRGGS